MRTSKSGYSDSETIENHSSGTAMNPEQNTMERQLEILATAVSVCRSARDGVHAAQVKLAELEAEKAEHLRIIQQHNVSWLEQESSRLQLATQSQQDTLALDFAARTESFRQQQEQTLQQLSSELADDVARLNEQEKSELWVLQSVLDEDAADSPIDQFNRERENFELQKTAMEQRADTLEQQLIRTQDYLTECHAPTDRQTPAPQEYQADGRDLTDVIRESGDELLAEAAALESQSLAQWTRGSRLWLLAGVVALVVTVVVSLFRRDAFRGLLNPGLAAPDWPWIGVSALCGFVAAAFFSVTCSMVVQSRLRNGFQSMLQHASNVRSLAELWEERSRQRLTKLERAAQKWRVQVAKRRERQTQQIRQQFKSKRDIIERRLSKAQEECESNCSVQEERIRGEQEAERQRLIQQLELDQQRAHRAADQQCEQQTTECHRQFTQTADNTTQLLQDLLHEWRTQLDTVKDLTRVSVESGAAARRWPRLTNGVWDPPEAMPQTTVPGDFLVTLPDPPRSIDDRTDAAICVEMPAVLRFPQDTAILVEHDAVGREKAISFLRTQILRLLTLIPPGRIRLTLIDPVGLGQSFSAMMHLADYDELLIQKRIWTDELQIRSQLKSITEHMENVFQTYLRSEFSTIEQYNASAGEVAEPYHFVVVAGFPQAFSEDAGRHLSSILTSGPSCGVHAMIAWNPDIGCPPGFDVGELRANCRHFCVRNETVIPVTDMPEPLMFEAFEEPSTSSYVELVRAVGEKSKDARRVEVSFRRVAPRADAIWQHSTSDGIDLPIGRAGAARLQYLRLGRGTSQHVLVAGKTGSGKSTFLHIVITNLALYYSPAEIQFYLIDFKKGVEFRTYAANRLPHAKVIAIESDREFGLSVLERLDEVLQERGDLFRTHGVQDVPSFRRKFPDTPMPRLLLLVDEFQEFFVAEDRVSSRASLLLDRLVRQGRAFGIHVMLGSQTLGGAYSLARSTMGQVAVRVALQCSESDAHLILSEDNSGARLLTRPGEAIYNDANGLKEGNHPFQIAWLDDDVREELIAPLKHRSDLPTVESSMIVFEGNVPPTVEQCQPLQIALRHSEDATRSAFDARSVWLGEPVAIAAPVQVELRRAGGQNLLLVGQEETLIDSMLALIILSICAEAGSRSSVTLLLSGRNEEASGRYRRLTDSGAVPGCRLLTADSCRAVIEEFTAEMQRREELPDHASSAEMLLVIRDIGQFREIRRDEDEFSLGSFGEPKEVTLSSRFGDLIRRGPLVGIHVVVWADTFSNAMRWLSNSLLREFENRIGLRMNQTDSASLVDSPVAAGLGPGRALLYRDQTGAVEKFRPFAWPTNEWLKQVAEWHSGDTDPRLDIESLQIE